MDQTTVRFVFSKTARELKRTLNKRKSSIALASAAADAAAAAEAASDKDVDVDLGVDGGEAVDTEEDDSTDESGDDEFVLDDGAAFLRGDADRRPVTTVHVRSEIAALKMAIARLEAHIDHDDDDEQQQQRQQQRQQQQQQHKQRHV